MTLEKSLQLIFFGLLVVSAVMLSAGENSFCDSTGPESECVIDGQHKLYSEEYGFSSVFISDQSSFFTSDEGMANIQVFNKTFISSLWEGSFNISTDELKVVSGTEFRPENGRIIVGTNLPDSMPVTTVKDCNTVSGSSGIYSIDPDGTGDFDVYCDMETDGGGWTQVATYAHDGNDYWSSSNRSNVINGNTYGSVSQGVNGSDYQSKAYKNVNAGEVMVRREDNPNKYLIYNILENQSLESRYVGGTNVVGTFYTEEVSGN